MTGLAGIFRSGARQRAPLSVSQRLNPRQGGSFYGPSSRIAPVSLSSAMTSRSRVTRWLMLVSASLRLAPESHDRVMGEPDLDRVGGQVWLGLHAGHRRQILLIWHRSSSS